MTTLENTIVLVYQNQVKLTEEQKEYLQNIISPIVTGINLKDKIFIRYDNNTISKEIVDYIIPILEAGVFDHLILDTKFYEEKMDNEIDHYLCSRLPEDAQQVIVISEKDFFNSGHKSFIKLYKSYENLKLYH